MIHGANSSSPTPLSSLLLCLPEATATISSKIWRPTTSSGVPSRITPQLMSMSSVMWRYMSEFRLASEHRAAARREADEIATTGHQSGDRHGVVAGRVHEDEAARGDGLAVVEDVHHRRRAALGHSAQRLLEHGRDPARLVAGRRVVVHRLDAAAVPLPPLVAIDELLGHALVDGAPDQQMLGTVDLGRLGEHAGP